MNTHQLTTQLDDFPGSYSRSLEVFSAKDLAGSYKPVKICVSTSLNEKERIIAYSLNQEAQTVHITGFHTHRQNELEIRN